MSRQMMIKGERKTIGFTAGEIAEIAQVMGDEREKRFLSEALTGRPAGNHVTVTSFSDAVRLLTQIGLRQVRQQRMAAVYRQSAERMGTLLDERTIDAIERAGGDAVEKMFPRRSAATE